MTTVRVEWPHESRELIAGARVARFATADASGNPHIVPICFVLNGDRLYWVVDAKPKKSPLDLKRLRNIAANPRVAVLVDRYDEDWSRLQWAMLRGTAAVVTDADEYSSAIDLLRRRYEQYTATAFRAATNPLVRVDIERVIGWRFDSHE